MLVTNEEEMREVLASAKRIAILGIKPASEPSQPAYYVSKYLKDAGYEVVPVPVYYPDLDEILGEKVYRTVAEIPDPVDLVVVFRRGQDIPPHVDDLLAAEPASVWFQLGIRNDEAAGRLSDAGMAVVQDRCAMVEHRRLV